MKKITSFLLMLTMLISIIYIPGITISAASLYSYTEITLPDGNTKLKNAMTTDILSTSNTIGNATQLAAIKDDLGKVYRLSGDIDFTSTATITISNANTAKPVIIDGRGWTIKTNKPIFATLPPGSEVRNLRIITTSSSASITPTSTISGNTCGSLAARSYGSGLFKNIVNEASVLYTPSLEVIRVGGIIGMVMNGDGGSTIFENCWNKGNVTGGKANYTPNLICGVGGIIGHVHDNAEVLLLNCQNNGTITNQINKTGITSNDLPTGSYAGGIVGSKTPSANLLMVNPSSVSNVTVGIGTTKGTYFSENNKNKYERVHDVEKLDDANEFVSLSGNKNYYLTNDISIDNNVQSHNVFSGRIYGFGKTITCTEPPFADMTQFTQRNLTIDVTGWTKIMDAADLAAIDNTKDSTKLKYYLGASFSLPADWTGPNEETYQDYNSAQAITFDGCGFEITTYKPIFPELPGGGNANDGTHSLIRNLKIAGNVSVNKVDLAKKPAQDEPENPDYKEGQSLDNGWSVGALVGKANGGIFKNIINNASVTVTDEMGARAGGLIGSVFNDDVYIEDCVNNGSVIAPIYGSNYGIGGIVGYIGYNTEGTERGVHAKIVKCVNNGYIKNTSEKAQAFAGGIIGIKMRNETLVYLIDCSNGTEAKIFANTAYGYYGADRLQQNLHVIKTIPISTEEEFMNISGNRAYSLTNDITISSPNTYIFNGFLMGYGHTVTTPNRLFNNGNDAWVLDVNVNPTELVINGQELDTFAIVVPTSAEVSEYVSESEVEAVLTNNSNAANLIKNHVQTKYSITLPIKTSADNYVGNAIYVNLGNDYYVKNVPPEAVKRTRFGFDYEMTSNGYFHVYLDGKDASATTTLVNSFLTQKLTTTKSGYDFFNNFGDKEFNYVFPTSGSYSGLVLGETDSRPIAKGVEYMERMYTNSSGAEIMACIVVIKNGAGAHLELQSAKHTHVDNCANHLFCDGDHILESDKKTVLEFGNELEATGKSVVAAMNGGYFMKSAGCNTPWGAQIVNGHPYREPWTPSGKDINGNSGTGLASRWFGVTNDGRPICGDKNNFATYRNQLQYAVNGEYYLIKAGSYTQTSSPNTKCDARSAIGMNANGDIILVCVAGDNNSTVNPGVTRADLSQIFMDLDMDVTYAINLDGGGSSAMMVNDGNGNLYLETPQYASADDKTLRPLTDALLVVLN